jgi:hypothetical protein
MSRIVVAEALEQILSGETAGTLRGYRLQDGRSDVLPELVAAPGLGQQVAPRRERTLSV